MCRVRDAVLRLLILLQAGYSEGFSLLLPLLSGEYKESPEPRLLLESPTEKEAAAAASYYLKARAPSSLQDMIGGPRQGHPRG